MDGVKSARCVNYSRKEFGTEETEKWVDAESREGHGWWYVQRWGCTLPSAGTSEEGQERMAGGSF